MLPADLAHTISRLTANNLLLRHPALLLIHVGLKYGPWRLASEQSAAEVGLTGQESDPCLGPDLLLRLLRATVCRMHKQVLSAWGPAVSFHSGGILWMKHLHIVEKTTASQGSLEMGSAGKGVSVALCLR